MREGNLDAPTRHPLDWQNPDFTDRDKIEAEMHRVFDICHGCRRCFNLCDSFPTLFDLVDAAGDEEMAGVAKADYQKVVDGCTLCDMCFLTKCPYVPPHEFNLDFPHLMLRYRAMELLKEGKTGFMEKRLRETDANGRLASPLAGLVNWADKRGNALTRGPMEAIAGVHRDADIPKYAGKTLVSRAASEMPPVNTSAPAHGRRAVVFATCFANFNNTDIGMATLGVLARNGVETVVEYPECCGMPQLEIGDVARVAEKARSTAQALKKYVDDGWDIVAPVPSCALMMKLEWPLIDPDNEDVARLAKATYDVTEYVVDIAAKEGLADGLKPIEGGVTLHLACHARAQNMGAKGAEMLRRIPETKVGVVERCSGHGGVWGIKKENFETAIKVGRPTARAATKNESRHISSECPLAAKHLAQGIEKLGEAPAPTEVPHPIVLFARAYGLPV